MKHIITSIIISLLSGILTTINAQLTLDCESGNRGVEQSWCWGFGAISYTSAKSQVISGDFSTRSNSMSNPSITASWIKTPWIIPASGDITLDTKLENGTGTIKQLILSYIPYEENSVSTSKEGNPVTFYTFDYPKSGNSFSQAVQKIKTTLPDVIVKNQKPVKILISFAGTGGSNRANADNISIPGTYISNPSDNCLPQTTEKDTDKDGVPDKFDQYPEDSEKAFNNYFPDEKTLFTLAYEDNWPAKGDYDLNDLVVDCQSNSITNADNKVSQIDLIVVLRASGASFRNAFALQLNNVPSENISFVKGNRIKNVELFKYTDNGVEDNQKFANIIIFDNFYAVMKHPGTGAGINTDENAPFVPYDTIRLYVKFKEPVHISELAAESFNYYMIPNVLSGNRGKEVHLADFIPTNLADPKLFNTYQDISGTKKDNGQINYYRTKSNLPWGIQIIQEFDYLKEKTPVNDGYLDFIKWAESSGKEYPDWYRDNQKNRNYEKIYSRKK